MKAVRISAGAGYAGDRIEPALENIRRGNVDYIMFECLAERTIALAQKDRAADPQKGYNRLLEYRMERVLPLLREHPVKIITNMGAANPVAAAEKVRKMAAQYDLTDLKIAAVIGDEVTERIPAYGDLAIMETGEPLHTLADKIVYTGPVDAYFDYKLGALQYRSVRFETEVLDTDNYQGNAVVNYTDAETPYTRIIEHKHFEFGTQPKTVISREYSAEWKKGDEPYYPVNDAKNGALYAEYKQLADAEPGVIFGGRLGEYKYYDMDKVIEAALDVVQKELA